MLFIAEVQSGDISMFLIDSKQNSKTTQITLPIQDKKESHLSMPFLEFLNISTKENSKKVIQNKTTIMPLLQNKDIKTPKDTQLTSLLNSLTNNTKQDTEELQIDIENLIQLDEQLAQIPSLEIPKDIKNLIFDAKKSLKEQILQSPNFKKSEIKNLPKTLKNLTVLAKKLFLFFLKVH